MTDPAQAVKNIGSVLTAEMGKKPPRMPLHRHHDDDYVDRIAISAVGCRLLAHIVPRYKTSGLSGDEWRISAVLDVYEGNELVASHRFHKMRNLEEHAAHFLYAECRELLASPGALMVVQRKGVELMQQQFRTFGDAAMGMGWHIAMCSEGRPETPWHHLTDEEERARCQQVGCGEPPKNVYHLNKLQVGNGRLMVEPEYDFTGQYTWYCARHTERGDCGLEDCDSNMTLVEGNGVPRLVESDESPSVLGGITHITLPTKE